MARIAAFVMAENLASGNAVTDAFGIHAKVEARAHWTPNQTFFGLMRGRTSINGMLAQLSGKKAADKLVSAKLKEQKAALATAAAANADWCPGSSRGIFSNLQRSKSVRSLHYAESGPRHMINSRAERHAARNRIGGTQWTSIAQVWPASGTK